MIKPEELRDQKFKIFLGMPMYGGLLTEPTMHGLLELQSWSAQAGINLRLQSIVKFTLKERLSPEVLKGYTQ